MNNPRRQSSQKYKKEVVALVRQSNEPISQVARNLGINDGVLSDISNRPGHFLDWIASLNDLISGLLLKLFCKSFALIHTSSDGSFLPYGVSTAMGAIHFRLL